MYIIQRADQLESEYASYAFVEDFVVKTVLCVPGHDEAKVKKCRQYGADLILFDLEDSVPDSMKDRARETVAANVQLHDHVRINRLTSSLMHDDIKAVFHRCGSVWLPKFKGEEVETREIVYGCVLIVETPDMVVKLSTLLRQSTRANIAGLAFGAADFAAYMNVPASSPQVQYARQQVALTAAALGIPAYDSPFTDLSPGSWGLFKDNLYQADTLGYQWKGVVHPAQIETVRVNSIRTGVFDRVLIERYDRSRGDEVVTLIDDQLIAPPMIRAARKRLEDSE